MYIYVYTHIPIYLCIHDLNEIQDLRMVHFRGKIQAFISLLKKQGLSQTMAWLQDQRSNQKQYLYFPTWTDLEWAGRKLAWILLEWLVTTVILLYPSSRWRCSVPVPADGYLYKRVISPQGTASHHSLWRISQISDSERMSGNDYHRLLHLKTRRNRILITNNTLL